ncbi:MAG: hypothetical protein HYZ66_05610 [Chlamydiae bacterium]|nr:hypothetical protein [Chlamydiota bacterium]
MEERTEDKNEVGRWLAVHEVQRKELKKMTVADKFSQLDSLLYRLKTP